MKANKTVDFVKNSPINCTFLESNHTFLTKIYQLLIEDNLLTYKQLTLKYTKSNIL